MLGGDWRHYGAPALVGLIFALLSVAVSLSDQRGECRGDDLAARYEACESEDASFRTPAPPANEKPQREEWRQEQDLQAQRDMAKWAWWMFVVSGAGVVVSLIAVLLIRDTLTETRKATEAAVRAATASEKAVNATIDTGARQSRCYLAVTQASIRFDGASDAAMIIPSTISGDGNPPLYITLTIKNFGQTPAYAVAWRPAVRYTPFFVTGDGAQMIERQSERLPAPVYERDGYGVEIGPQQEVAVVARYGFNPNQAEFNASRLTRGAGGLYIGVVISLTRIDAFDRRETRDYGFSGQINVYSPGTDHALTATSAEVFMTQEQVRAAAQVTSAATTPAAIT